MNLQNPQNPQNHLVNDRVREIGYQLTQCATPRDLYRYAVSSGVRQAGLTKEDREYLSTIYASHMYEIRGRTKIVDLESVPIRVENYTFISNPDTQTTFLYFVGMRKDTDEVFQARTRADGIMEYFRREPTLPVHIVCLRIYANRRKPYDTSPVWIVRDLVAISNLNPFEDSNSNGAVTSA